MTPSHRSVGTVRDLTHEGSLLVEAPPASDPEGPPARTGSELVDARRNVVGRVVDVIGPVTAPYIVVAPSGGSKVHRLLGKELYAR